MHAWLRLFYSTKPTSNLLRFNLTYYRRRQKLPEWSFLTKRRFLNLKLILWSLILFLWLNLNLLAYSEKCDLLFFPYNSFHVVYMTSLEYIYLKSIHITWVNFYIWANDIKIRGSTYSLHGCLKSPWCKICQLKYRVKWWWKSCVEINVVLNNCILAMYVRFWEIQQIPFEWTPSENIKCRIFLDEF